MDREAISHLNQTRSPLLRLPPELRNRIYEYVYESSFAGQEVNVREQLGPHLFLRNQPLFRVKSFWSDHNPPTTRLEATSRQLRQETANLFYILNTFRGGPADIVALISHFGRRAHRIQAVRIVAFEELVGQNNNLEPFPLDIMFRQVLAKLQGLSGLKRIHIRCRACDLGRYTRDEVLQGVRYVLELRGREPRGDLILELEVVP